MSLPDERTHVRTRLLQRGLKYAETVGLTVGLDTEFVQQLCSDERVSEREFGQIWPTPTAFLSDLCLEIADQARIDRTDTQTLLVTWEYLSHRTEDLHSVKGRRRVLIDVIRMAAEYNFDVVTASNKWRTYAAISTTVMSWPDAAARTRLSDAFRTSQMLFVETMESFYRNVLPTVGYRLKPMFHHDYQPFVIATAAVIEGLGIVRSTVPALVESHFTMAVADGEEDWSVPALSFMGVVDAFIEPDPDFTAESAISRLSGGVDVTPVNESGDSGRF